ncbi:MAG: NAD-binding protein [Pseudomonadales bacterium]|nr:NAD-binding protein [Pseudomonadales bacterium]MCP5185845.1 NAD-binding protein [Pseudomonadales bacterium]
MFSFPRQFPGWRWYAAVLLVGAALLAFGNGVGLTEEPDVRQSGLLAQAYYSLGLFVVGGLDMGFPTGGPAWARALLWVAYFGAPMLTASAVMDALLRILSPRRWQMRRLKDHIVVVGAGDLTTSYLRVLRRAGSKLPVVVVDRLIDASREVELVESFGVMVVRGDATHDFILRELRVRRARRILMLGEDDFATYEAATRILSRYPRLTGRLVLHCHNLRFMRSLADTTVASQATTFNAYNFAATNLVSRELLAHFAYTGAKDVVVLGGFGRFGQTVLEELEQHAGDELEAIAIIDVDADRRLQVAEEQSRLRAGRRRHVLQGNISHPQVWRRLREELDLSLGEPVVILGTGDAAQNLRTALWVRQQWPNCLVFTRTHDNSELVALMGREHGVRAVSITELLETHLPQAWVA